MYHRRINMPVLPSSTQQQQAGSTTTTETSNTSTPGQQQQTSQNNNNNSNINTSSSTSNHINTPRRPPQQSQTISPNTIIVSRQVRSSQGQQQQPSQQRNNITSTNQNMSSFYTTASPNNSQSSPFAIVIRAPTSSNNNSTSSSANQPSNNNNTNNNNTSVPRQSAVVTIRRPNFANNNNNGRTIELESQLPQPTRPAPARPPSTAAVTITGNQNHLNGANNARSHIASVTQAFLQLRNYFAENYHRSAPPSSSSFQNNYALSSYLRDSNGNPRSHFHSHNNNNNNSSSNGNYNNRSTSIEEDMDIDDSDSECDEHEFMVPSSNNISTMQPPRFTTSTSTNTAPGRRISGIRSIRMPAGVNGHPTSNLSSTRTSFQGGPETSGFPYDFEFPSAHSHFRYKIVCRLNCKSCSRLLCTRGMKAILLADTKVELYSTDTPPAGVSLVNDDYMTENCRCRIHDVACLGCGNVVGYHVTQPCDTCLDSCNNGHFWMFQMDGVESSERFDASGTKPLLWAFLPPAERDVDGIHVNSQYWVCR